MASIDSYDSTSFENWVNKTYPVLKLGCKDSDYSFKVVTNLQIMLGLDDNYITGEYDSYTENAVKDYQKNHGIDVDGIVGTKTWSSLGFLIDEVVVTPDGSDEVITASDDSDIIDGGTLDEVTVTASKIQKNTDDSSSDTNSNSSSSSKSSNDSNSSGSSSTSSYKYILKPMRTAIKTMAKVAQIANAVSQIPKPTDFALLISSDVIYLAAKANEIVTDINEILDSYTDIPFNFLDTQLNGIVSTATDIIQKVDNYATSNISDALDFAKTTVALPTELINTSIDMYSSTSAMVKSVSSNTQILSEMLKGNTDNAKELKENLQEAIENISKSSESAKADATKALTNASNAIDTAAQHSILGWSVEDENGTTTQYEGWVTAKTKSAENAVDSFKTDVQEWINKIRNNVTTFSNTIDSYFSVNSDTTDKLQKLSEIEVSEDDDAFTQLATNIIAQGAKTTSNILQNFSVGKLVTACAGMTASVLMIETGLDKLPPISTDKILSGIVGAEQKLVNSNVDFDDLVQYNPNAYKKYQEEFEKVLQDERNNIREKMANKQKKLSLLNELKANNNARKEYLKQLEESNNGAIATDEIKSAIKEIRKKRKQARKGKRANKLKSIILSELKKFYEEIKALISGVKTKWNNMMNTYKKTVSQIKSYFTKDGCPGNDEIERICNDMEQNCSDIYKLCVKDLPTQIAQVSANVTMPRALGTCMPNFAQHIVQWIADIKIIIKFIMDLIKYVKNIINDINLLVKIIINGIKSAGEIYSELMELLSLQWLIDLVEKIQDSFKQALTSTTDILENTLEAVYFEDTDDFEEMMDGIDNLIEVELPEGMTTRSYVEKIYSYVAGNNKLTDSLSSVLSFDLAKDIYNGTADEDDIDKLEDELDDMGKTIVAYRSVVFKRNDNEEIIYSDDDGTETTFATSEPVIEKYIYYHPDLYHFDKSCFGGLFPKARRKRKSKYIQRAAKLSNKKNGGVAMLKNKSKLFKNKKTNKNVSAWDAFYWYQVMTDNTDVDFLGTDNTETNISKVVFNTQTGSVVLVDLGNGNTQRVFVENANVKSGDYVTYNGQKYKIK